ncbi:MAG TPA: CoA transferase, partial [Dehalococcoidia bacterium]|nr:CoA transferase [Dehalococcoidia bacterium]
MAGALAGLRVIEWAEGIAGPYCGRLLADSGADVIKVEPPEGDVTRRSGPFPGDKPHPERSALFANLNTSKRSVTLNPRDPAGRDALDRLIAAADILIEDRPAGLLERAGFTAREILARYPRLVVVSITPYGRSGPASGSPGADLVTFMVSGLGHITPQGVKNPEHEPPLRLPGYQSEFVAGMTAAAGALHGLFLRDSGAGGQHVDVAAQEALASFAFMLVGATAFMKRETPRQAPSNAYSQWINSLFRCADGYVSAVMMEEHQWKAWVEVLGSPEWAADPRFASGLSRNQHWADLKPLIEAWTTQQTKADVASHAQSRRVPVLPVNTIADVWASEQLNARGFFVTVDQPELGAIRLPGHAFRMSRTPWAMRPAPRLGEHNAEVLGSVAPDLTPPPLGPDVPALRRGEGEHAPSPTPDTRHSTPSSGPLAGLRVADFSWVFAGPICTRNLAALGAEVIRIESHRRIDSHRLSGFRDAEGRPRINASPYFYLVNYNKRSVSLDISKPEGLALAKEIV